MGVNAVMIVRGDAPVADVIASRTRTVVDFPKPGIQFKDLTPMFADREAMTAVVDALADVASGADLVAGIESRGSLVGAAIAARLGTGMLFVRKKGKLPPPVLSEDYHREYGAATIEIPAECIDLQDRDIVIIDDVLATGGTLCAANRLLTRAGANVVSAGVIVELVEMAGRESIAPVPVHSLSRV